MAGFADGQINKVRLLMKKKEYTQAEIKGNYEEVLKCLLNNENDQPFYDELWSNDSMQKDGKYFDMYTNEFWEKFLEYFENAFPYQNKDIVQRHCGVNTLSYDVNFRYVKNPGRCLFYIFEEPNYIGTAISSARFVAKLFERKEDFNCELRKENDYKILKADLETNQFDGISCIVLLVRALDENIGSLVVGLLDAVSRNEFVQRKAKIVPIFADDQRKMKNAFITKSMDSYFSALRGNPERYLHLMCIDNLYVFSGTEFAFIIDLHIMLCRPQVCIQQFFSEQWRRGQAARVLIFKQAYGTPIRSGFNSLGTSVTVENSAVDIFVYTINASLIICMHNFKYPEEKLIRHHDEKDVTKIENISRIHGMPVFIIKDQTAAQVRAYMKRIQELDLSSLHNLFLFIMSHGNEGDTIRTRDGDYNLYSDVVRPLQYNPTLKQVRIFIFVAACRGRTKLPRSKRNADPEPPQPVIPQNITIFFSTTKHFVSYRNKDGTLFIDAVHKVFSNPFEDIKLDTLIEIIEEVMRTRPTQPEDANNGASQNGATDLKILFKRRRHLQKFVNSLYRALETRTPINYLSKVMLIKDATTAEIKAYIERIGRADFSGLPNVYLFIMTCGNDGDTIRSNDGVYHLFDDVVQKLCANRTLEDVKVRIFLVDSRVENFTNEWDYPCTEEQSPSKNIPDNIDIFSITSEACWSYRNDGSTATFIDAVHATFQNPFENMRLDVLFAKIEKLMCAKMKELNAFEFRPEMRNADENSDLHLSKFVEDSNLLKFFDALYKDLNCVDHGERPNII